ncbi:MAG: hypothetical protein KDC92_11000, partial [Bacteroidetes bacterium]|nr:hypothetical protein [Bacteroidota bacterium]
MAKTLRLYLIPIICSFGFNSNAQTYLLGSGYLDAGFMSGSSFQNNVLANRTSTTFGIGLGLQYRFRNVFALEAGIGQFGDNIRLRDQVFEDTYSAHSLVYNQHSRYLGYYGSAQILIPVIYDGWLFLQCGYQMYFDKAETVSKTFEYEILKAEANHLVNATATFGKRDASILPEIGFQYELKRGVFASAGVKLDFSQKNLVTGTYELHDIRTNEILRTDAFSNNGNSFSFNLKLSVGLHEFIKREKPKPQPKPEKEKDKEEIIVVKKDNDKDNEKSETDDVEIEVDN